MKTTLDLPDAIYRELKIRAAREGSTLTKLITSALASALNRAPDAVATARQQPLETPNEQKICEWMEAESAFLESMRGPVFGEGAVDDLLEGRR